MRAAARTEPTSRNITANGFSSRRFRCRSARTASSFVASTASWKPPSPRIAAIDPARIARVTAPIGSSVSTGAPSPSRTDSRGPQAGQAFGSAWKRRSRGSPYSFRHAAHIGKAAIDVRSRS